MEVVDRPTSMRIRASDCYPEVVPNSYYEKQALDHQQLPSSFEEEEEPIVLSASKPPIWKRKRLWAGVLLPIVVVAAFVGGLAGGLQHKHTSNATIGDNSSGAGNESAEAGNTGTSSTSVPSQTRTQINSDFQALPTATIPQMTGSAKVLATYAYPTAISWGAPHLEIYIPGKANGSNSVYRKYRSLDTTDTSFNPTGDALEWVGGPMADYETSIAAIARSVGNVDIFATGPDQAVYHRYHVNNVTWPLDPSHWESRGGNLTTAPSVITWNANRIDFFALGDPNGTLFQQTWTSTTPWTGYINLGGSWANFIPTVVTWGENRVDIFTIEPNTNELYHTFYDGTAWQPSEGLGGYCTSRPTAVSWGVGRLDVFVRGGDAGLWHLAYNGTWSVWNLISGSISIQAEPEAVSWGADRIDVFAWGADSSLLHKSFDGNSWTPPDGFETLGALLAGPPKAVSDAVGSLHVVSISTQETLQHLSYSVAIGAWSPGAGADNLGTIPN